MVWIGLLYLVSALGSALAWDPFSFSVFRFIGGLGVGASSVAAPAYISEIAPTALRGRLVILYQFTLVTGILVAYISNYFLGFIGEGAWRWMLGVEAIPAGLYLLLGQFSGGPIFAFFAFMMVFQLIWAVFFMPETKGVSLEALEKQWRG